MPRSHLEKIDPALANMVLAISVSRIMTVVGAGCQRSLVELVPSPKHSSWRGRRHSARFQLFHWCVHGLPWTNVRDRNAQKRLAADQSILAIYTNYSSTSLSRRSAARLAMV